MSSLTDFEGILAEKTGSSSDTNVLTLTSADSSAVAGTHTVEVGNLAQTSSGYLTQIANADDPLSGSITLQAGNGSPLTIILNSSNNTLAGLAATINCVRCGHQCQRSDRFLRLDAEPGFGYFGRRGKHHRKFEHEYSGGHRYGSAEIYRRTNGESGSLTALANTTDTLNGSLTIKVGTGTAETIVVGAAPSGGRCRQYDLFRLASGWNTLTGLESAINTASLGVTASIVTSSSGAQSLSLTSRSLRAI